VLTVADVAERLKCSRALVYAIIESGQLGCYRIGLGKQGGVRVSEEQLSAYLHDREQSPAFQATPLKHLRLR
jgi:excisionase family DNA binding protein